ncbi:alpha-L-glutamate ligase [Oleiphilus sp. HI0125]|uniref:ATP-grasp domain-containing protein n=1 Tax=Oleiphilus sp. HI0125 TaxID=1822266 RepID=UPI0007C38898|nr:ATP-grasp domain-containing protein [Oleiphilus sp. HI0125]KZZ60677.1 alpha-L-glutamate ligase [Oleiphilus sp. HI0125]
MQDIYIIHENEEWVVPLRAAFAEHGVEAKEWFLNQGVINLNGTPPEGIYYNRMSASSHTRGNRYAPELTRLTLNWLTLHNREIINGPRAIYYEVDKFSQYCALQKHGIKTPLTHAVVGKENLIQAATDFDQIPFIIKPNRGGKGLGVKLIHSISDLENFIESDDYEEPLDGTWLIQEYIKSDQTFIVRAEFVGAKFLYTVKVKTDGGFELCPADVCDISDAFCPTSAPENKFELIDTFDNHALMNQLETFLSKEEIDIAGIEFIQNEIGDLLVYDINTNTNYNHDAEKRAGIDQSGMQAIASLLIDKAK